MRTGRRSRWLLSGAVAVVLAGAHSLWAGDARTDAHRKLVLLAQELGVPESSLEVVREAEVNLPHLGKRLATAKIRDRTTGELYEVTLDASGTRVDKQELIRLEVAARRARYGKLEPALHDRLADARSNEPIGVAIWYEAPDDPIRSPSRDEVRAMGEAGLDAYLAQENQRRRAQLTASRQPLLTALQSMGAKVTHVDDFVAVVTAELYPAQISAIAARPDVKQLSLLRMNREQLDVSAAAVTAPEVWARGYTGTGRSIGIIERSRILFRRNGYLAGLNRLNQCAVNDHATKVAGVAASTHSTYRGVAHGATLLGGEACTLNDADLMAATSWAINNGARVLNNSWGGDTSGQLGTISRYHDDLVRLQRVTVVDVAGNCDPGCMVLEPAVAYNVIAVGGYDDGNTATWSGDVIDPLSSYIDPGSTNGDRNKPEVVAPGVNIMTTSETRPWITASPGVTGTSFATPHVSGIAALLMQRDNALQVQPEAVKAILMATAANPVGATGPNDDRVGAGGVSAADADWAVWYQTQNSSPITWEALTLTPADFAQLGRKGFPRPFVPVGSKVRVAIVWDANSSYVNYAGQPGVDLDLEVHGFTPSGQDLVVASSFSFDNTYEVAEFTVSSTANYSVHVVNKRFEDADVRFAIAFVWFPHANP